MAFSATDAAFEGFRLVRRTPLTLLIWALLYVGFGVALFALVGGSLFSMVDMAATLENNPNPAPEDLMPFMGAYFSLLGMMLPLALVFGAVMYGAVNRAVLRPHEKGFGYVRLGMDEVRIFVVTLVLTILAAIAAFVVMMIFGVIAGVAGVAMGDSAGLIAIVLGIACVVLFVWVALRFSLAVPITFAERRIAIFDSWGLTKGHTLGLLGMGVIAVVMAFVVQILAYVVAMPLIFMVGGFAQLAQIETMDFAQIMQTMAPVLIIYAVLASLLYALQLGIIYAPFAVAYRDIRGGADPVGGEPTPSM